MIKRYKIGDPIDTNAVPEENLNLFSDEGAITDGILADNVEVISTEQRLLINMGKRDRVFGLGQAVRGINKRGWIYESFCSDEPHHEETKRSLYGAHNFIILQSTVPSAAAEHIVQDTAGYTRPGNAGNETSGEYKYLGLFVDSPARVTFDIGYTDKDLLQITLEDWNAYIYIISGDGAADITTQFRRLIGKSYKPPKWAFGYGQSRWGYKDMKGMREVVRRHREAHVPLDMLFMDIDYMEDFKDFTVNHDNFPDFKTFVDEMKAEHIHLIPIIDAGIKEQTGYEIYEDGLKENIFVKDEEGNPFVAAVWPGRALFPDFLNEKARSWFGDKYKYLIDAGIDGFWNDMNEPAIFYTPKRLEEAIQKISNLSGKNVGIYEFFDLTGVTFGLQNSIEDYKSFYHVTDDGGKVRHDRVHNIYGMNMTRAASDSFRRNYPDRDILLFSRASYIGAHRYGGIWQGDNISWWSHLRLNVAMTANLNMCGFIYTGADIGGFGDNTTEDLLLRWLAFGIFTPLMRNHKALGNRQQEFYQFKDNDAARHIIGLRYRLLPYIMESFERAVEDSTMMFRPLCFDYPNDERTYDIEDQLMYGDRLMIAPVVQQNAEGRMVYLPEKMTLIRLGRDESGTFKEMRDKLPAGDHYIQVPIDEVVIFLKNDYQFELADFAEWIDI